MNKKTFKELGDFLGMAIAMDECGLCYAFEKIPQKSDGHWYNGMGNFEVSTVAEKPVCGWEESLYIPEYLKPKYKPLSFFNSYIIGMKIYNDGIEYGYIVGFDLFERKVVVNNNDCFDTYTLEQLLNFKDKNGNVFGEEIIL